MEENKRLLCETCNNLWVQPYDYPCCHCIKGSKYYNPSLQPAKRIKCPQCQAYAEYDLNGKIICNNAHCKTNEDREVIPLYSLRRSDEPPKILKDKIKKSNDLYYQKNKEMLNQKRRKKYEIDEHYQLVMKTHQFVQKALKDKVIIKPNVCDFCHKEVKRLEGHHEDYSKPLELKWLCRKCHSRVHNGVINLGDLK